MERCSRNLGSIIVVRALVLHETQAPSKYMCVLWILVLLLILIFYLRWLHFLTFLLKKSEFSHEHALIYLLLVYLRVIGMLLMAAT
uniref:Uncharacterized protein n=1 Tax=Aegilops tauschii subsp. strangulata TaxID=200361 RepID=A0A452XWP5_AEGTS